jgi:hypothetical protein
VSQMPSECDVVARLSEMPRSLCGRHASRKVFFRHLEAERRLREFLRIGYRSLVANRRVAGPQSSCMSVSAAAICWQTTEHRGTLVEIE